jgi:hypothetical protein
MSSPQNLIASAKSLRFVADGHDYVAGDERTYSVIFRGTVVGTVERTYLVGATEDDSILGWGFRGRGDAWGEGRTRAAAVLAAFAG